MGPNLPSLEDADFISAAYRMEGREMREKRAVMGVSQKTLARIMCVHSQSISDWECGRRPITSNVGRLFLLIYAVHIHHTQNEGP